MEHRMTIIITMAGLGTRFRKAGYQVPKYMIEAKGKTLFEWSMDSLKGYQEHTSRYIFVVRREDQASAFIRSRCAAYGIEDVKILEIDQMTDGQATTCMLAVPYCDPEDAIMVYNIDTYVEPYEMRYEAISGDGHIPCFHAEGDHWSFAKTDEQGQVTEVRKRCGSRITVLWGLIIFLLQNYIESFMRSIMRTTVGWRRMRSISHLCIII